MASHPPLHISADLELDLSDPHSLTVRYPGDVHLSQTFGRPLAGAQVGGDLTLDLPTVTGTCVAQGVLKTHSRVDAIRLTGRELHLSGTEIRARALSASERILIGPCTLMVDVIIAPVVHIHPDAKGRVTVVESHNELGPNQIRGAFSLDEYEHEFGGALDFLAGRGVGPLDRAIDLDALMQRPRAIVTTVERETPAQPAQRGSEPEELDDFVELELLDEDGDDDSYEGVTVVTLDDGQVFEVEDEAPTLDPDGEPDEDSGQHDEVEVIAYDQEDLVVVHDEDEGIIEPARPLPPRAPTPAPPPERPVQDSARTRTWFRQVEGLVEGIEAAYEIVPDEIVALRDLVERRHPERLEHELDQVWTDTVKHHRQARIPVDPRVAHRFRVLSELVQQRPA